MDNLRNFKEKAKTLNGYFGVAVLILLLFLTICSCGKSSEQTSSKKSSEQTSSKKSSEQTSSNDIIMDLKNKNNKIDILLKKLQQQKSEINFDKGNTGIKNLEVKYNSLLAKKNNLENNWQNSKYSSLHNKFVDELVKCKENFYYTTFDYCSAVSCDACLWDDIVGSYASITYSKELAKNAKKYGSKALKTAVLAYSAGKRELVKNLEDASKGRKNDFMNNFIRDINNSNRHTGYKLTGNDIKLLQAYVENVRLFCIKAINKVNKIRAKKQEIAIANKKYHEYFKSKKNIDKEIRNITDRMTEIKRDTKSKKSKEISDLDNKIEELEKNKKRNIKRISLLSGERKPQSVQDYALLYNASGDVMYTSNPPLDGPSNGNKYFIWSGNLVTREGNHYIVWGVTHNIWKEMLNEAYNSAIDEYDTAGFAFKNILLKYGELLQDQNVTVVGKYIGNTKIQLVSGEEKYIPILDECIVCGVQR